VRFFLGIICFILLAGCDSHSDTGDVNDVPLNKNTIYIGPTELKIPMGVEYFFSDTITDANGLSISSITVDVDGGPDATLVAESTTSVRFEFSYTPTSAEDDVTVTVSGTDNDGFPISLRTIILDATSPTDTPGGAVDLSPSIGIAGRASELRIYGYDPDGLVSGFIDADGQRFEQNFSGVSGHLVASVMISSKGLIYSGGFVDMLGNTTSFEGGSVPLFP